MMEKPPKLKNDAVKFHLVPKNTAKIWLTFNFFKYKTKNV